MTSNLEGRARRATSIAISVGVSIVVAAQPARSERHVYIGSHFDNAGGVDGLAGAERVAVSPDGTHVYVTGVVDDRVSIFERDATSGVLTFVGTQSGTGMESPRDVVVSPDGLHVYVVSSGSQAIVAFSRDGGTGLLTFIEVEDSGSIPGSLVGVALAINSDGAHIYVADPIFNTVVVFSRNATTGELTYVETQEDGMGGVDGLNEVRSVAVSPDGSHVYAGGAGDDAIAIFDRNSITGALTFVGIVQDGVGGVDGLDGVTALTLSGDGANLYATAGGEAKVAVFERNVGTGALTFVEAEPALVFPAGVAVSADGSHAYVTHRPTGNGMLTFHRDGGSGALTLDEQFVDGSGGIDGLFAAFGVVVSPDDGDVYVTANDATGIGALSSFRRITFSCSAGPAGGCFQPAQPQKGKLTIKDNVDDAADKIVWKWLRGAAVTLGDFGDPIGTFNDYALCVYDASGGGQLVAELLAPARIGCEDAGASACWKPISTTGLKYVRTTRHPDGVTPVKLVSGAAGSSKALVRAKGESVPLPALPLTAPVTVQLQNADGDCWENVFSSPIINTTTLLKATAD